MSLLERPLGYDLAYQNINRIRKYTKTEDVFLHHVDIVLHEMDQLNVVLFSLQERYASTPYWIDNIKELYTRLMPIEKPCYVCYEQFGYGSIILTNVMNSMRMVLANELIEYAVIPATLDIPKATKFVIDYHSLISTVRDYFRNIDNTVSTVRDAISDTLKDNEPNIMTKLAQLTAMRVQSVEELHAITIESLVPALTR